MLLVVVHRRGLSTSYLDELIVVDVLVRVMVAPAQDGFQVVSPRRKAILLQESTEFVQRN